MRVLVTGGRDFKNTDWLWSVLDKYSIHHLITGGATGADQAAQAWAIKHNIPYSVYVPDWKKDGTAAGPIRNQVMLDASRPDLVLAFPGGRGTADMVRRADFQNITVKRNSTVEYYHWLNAK